MKIKSFIQGDNHQATIQGTGRMQNLGIRMNGTEKNGHQRGLKMNRVITSNMLLGVGLLIVSLLSLSSSAFGAGEPYSWVFQDDPTAPPNSLSIDGNENADASVLDSAGDLILTGYADGNGTLDYYTMKVSGVDKTVLWRRTFKGAANGDDWATLVAVDSQNNIIVSGHSYTQHSLSSSNDDILTIKYDSDGNEVWLAPHIYNGPENDYDYPTGIAIDRNDNIYISGYTNSGALAGENYVLFRLNSGGPNPDGSATWKEIGDNILDDRFTAVTVGPSEVDLAKDVVVVTGYTTRCQKYCDDNTTTNDVNGKDYLTMKFDWDGPPTPPIWSAVYDNSQISDTVSVNDSGKVIALASNGDVLVSGTIENPGRIDALTIRYSAAGAGDGNGTIVWQSSTDHLISNSPTEPRGLVVDENDQIFLTGYTFTNGGMDDFYTAHLNSDNGTIMWEGVFDNPYESGDTYDGAAAIAVDDTEGVFVTGSSYKFVTGDYDFLTVKYHKETGNILWSSTYDGPSGGDEQPAGIAVALGVDLNGDIFVGGYSEFTVGLDTELDFCAIKYPGGLLDRPTDLVATVNPLDATKIDLTWQDNSSAPNNEDHFCVQRCEGWNCFFDLSSFSDCAIPADSTTYNDSGLTSGTWYTYRVKGVRSSEPYDSNYSNTSHALAMAINYPVPTWLFMKDYAGSDDLAYGIAAGADNNPVAIGMVAGVSTQSDYYTVKLDHQTTDTIVWQAYYNDGDSGGDVGKVVTIDRNNDVIVSGFASLSNGPGGNTNDIYTMKYADDNGAGPIVGPDGYSSVPLWAAQYAGPGNGDDRAEAIAAMSDASGNIVVIGYGQNSAAGGNDDIYVVKYAGDCPEPPCNQEIWAAPPYDSGGDDYPSSIALVNNLDVVVGGEIGTVHDINGVQTSADIFIGKYSGMDGAMASGWPFTYDGLNGVDGINGVAVDKEGNVYAAGYVASSSGDIDWYINKFNPTGVPQWGANGTRVNGGSGINGYDEAVAILVDPTDGNIVVGGTITSKTGSPDFRVIRYSPDGTVLWQKDLDRATNDDYAMSMALSPSGDICLAGETTDATAETTDIMAILYDHRDGTLLGSTIYDSTFDDYTTAITSNNLGEFFISGYSGGGTMGEDWDFLVVKLEAAPILQAPSPFTVTAQEGNVTLTWTENDNTVGGYYIFKQPGSCNPGGGTLDDGDKIKSLLLGDTSHTFTDLGTNSESYCFGVQVYKLFTGVSAIIESDATTVAPNPPDNFVATIEDTTTIKLCWNDNTDTESGFVIERCTGVNCTFDPFNPEDDLLTIDQTELPGSDEATYCYTDVSACDSGKGYGNGKTFSYRVQAVNTSIHWNSAFTSPATNMTPQELPQPTSLVSLSESDSEIVVQWNDNSLDEEGYRVRRCDDTLANCTPFPATPDQEFSYGLTPIGLSLLLEMEEASWTSGTAGDAADSSGTGNDATSYNGTNTVLDDERGQVAYFDGANDYLLTPLTIEQADNATGVTIMAWVKDAGLVNHWGHVFSTDSSSTSGIQYNWGLQTYNGWWYIDNGSTRLNVSNNVNAGQWQHIAVVFDPIGGVAKLYVNAVLMSPAVALGTFPIDVSAPLTFGRRGGDATGYWGGWLDEATVVKRPLTQAEIEEFSVQGVPLPGTGRFTDRSIQPDLDYTYQIVGYKATNCGNKALSVASLSLATSTTPDPPTNLTGVTGSSSAVYLSWHPETVSQTTFQIERCQGNLTTCVGDSDFTDILSSSIEPGATHYQDDSVCFGTWVYRLKALGIWPNNGGETTYSNRAEVTLAIPPGPSSFAVSETSEEEVSLSWTIDGTDWDGFTIERCDGNATECLSDGNFTAVSGSPLSPYLSGLVGLWRMDEHTWDDNASTNEVLDSSGNGNHGNTVNNTQVSSLSRYGYGAASFNGSESIETPVQIDQSVSSPGATFEAWIYVSSAHSATQAIFSTDDGGNDWSVYLKNNTLWVDTGSSMIDVDRPITYNSWNHVVVAFVPGLGVNVYLNGGNKKTIYNIDYDSSSRNLSIGSKIGSYYFYGLIDEAAVYDRPLTDDEVTARYLHHLSFSENGLAEGDYTYRVEPNKSTLCGTWYTQPSYEQVTATLASPQSPNTFSATFPNTTTIDLHWINETTSETSLRLARCQGSGTACDDYATEFTDIAPALMSGSESYSDNTTCEGTQYTYWLRAEKSGSPTGWPTAWVSATTIGLAAKAPTLNVTILSESEADVSWDDNGTDEEQFVLSRCLGIGCLPVSPTDDIFLVPGTATGRVLHYRMDEADWTGGVLDESGNGNTGTAYNGATLIDETVRGRVGFFDGSNDYIQTPLSVDMSASSLGVTFEAWVKPTLSNYAWRYVMSSLSSDGVLWGITHYNGLWYIDNGYSTWSTGVPVVLDDWQHVAVTFTPFQGAKFYLNGTEYSNTNLGYSENTSQVSVGRHAGGYNYFTGMIDEVIVHDHPLSLTEIVRHVNEKAYAWTYQNIGLTPGGEYTFRLEATKPGWCGPVVSQVTVTMPQPPAPENLQVIPNTTGFHLLWEDKAGAESGFMVRRCQGDATVCTNPDDNVTQFSQEFNLVGQDIQEYMDDGICTGSDYTYAVRDKKDPPSEWVTSWNTNGPISATRVTPLIPAITSAVQINEVQLDLEWDNTNDDETGYTVEKCEPIDGCKEISLDADVTSYQAVELKPKTCYTFRVRAEQSGTTCPSLWPTSWSDNATVCTALLAPGTIDANAIDTTTVDLVWTDMAETETGTIIERCVGDLAYCCDGNATNCNDLNFVEAGRVGPDQTHFIDAITPLSQGDDCYNQEYHYRVRSLDEGLSQNGGGAWSLRTPVQFNNGFQALTGIEIIVPRQPEMNQDYSDLRFYDDVAKRELMTFWIRETTADHATVWLMTGDNQGIYLYYGNSLAGDATVTDQAFTQVYDDFQGTIIDSEKWLEIDDGAFVSQNNRLSINHHITLWNGLISTAVFGRTPGNEIIVNLDIAYQYYHRTHENVLGWGMDQSSSVSDAELIHGIYLFSPDSKRGTSRFRPIENGSLLEPSPGRYFSDAVGSYDVKVVLKDAGADYYIRGGIYTDWTLVYDQAVTSHVGDDNLRLVLGARKGASYINSISVKQVTRQLLASVDFGSASTPPNFENTWTGSYSAAASVSTYDIVTVSDLQTVAGMDGQMNLNWAASLVNDEEGYEVERCYGTGCSIFTTVGYADANATRFVDVGAAPSNSVTYRVMAYKNGSCPWVSPAAEGSEVLTPPVAEFGLQASVLNAFAVELFWDDNNTDGDSFEIETQIWNGRWVSVNIVDDNVTTYLDTSGVNPSTEYTYRVRALKGTDQSSVYSNEVTVKTDPYVDGNSTTTCVAPSP